MALANKATAELLRYAFRYSLVDLSAIRSWGDSLIEQCEVAPEWLIDVALANGRDADTLLKRVPDDDVADDFTPLLCAMLLSCWRDGSISIGNVRSLGWELHMANLLPEIVDGFANWGVTLEVQAESLDEGWVTEAEIRDLIASQLSQYEPIIQEIPEWANQN